MPIYAQDVYFDENYIVIPEDTAVEAVGAVEEDVVVEDVNEEAVVVEDVNEEDPLLKMDGDSKFLIDDYITDDSLALDDMMPIHLGSSSNANRLV